MDTEDTPGGTATEETKPTTWCPSGRADAPESVVLGVRSQSDASVTYLAAPTPAAELLPMIPANIEPTRVLRFASHCVSGCAHRSNNDCTLISKIQMLPAAGEPAVPRCHLRARCQWWRQTGATACQRCPAVSTAYHADDSLSTRVADPAVTPAQLQRWIDADHDAAASDSRA
ncbi:hypothetical protein [Streptomyces sp. AK02-01A]|uniref:hypothetical protein n=1 Tax=Streptomyces sp. AK02-01A TaxID=3028648 RepID=UPI0029B53FB4|nr:hypothetical protein [Streptomyces sp. AK02-01A]MDX3852322.1 hypothetical protein [Streptomyces sp. AK02-01A]